ncbi:unnamed protein product [Leptosia nina]|uniref:Uncharacterized protein n=1 Tax=Leptosia nina TaxID=320188 RepID=A0AAV1JV56_9NEOP
MAILKIIVISLTIAYVCARPFEQLEGGFALQGGFEGQEYGPQRFSPGIFGPGQFEQGLGLSGFGQERYSPGGYYGPGGFGQREFGTLGLGQREFGPGFGQGGFGGFREQILL